MIRGLAGLVDGFGFRSGFSDDAVFGSKKFLWFNYIRKGLRIAIRLQSLITYGWSRRNLSSQIISFTLHTFKIGFANYDT